MNAGASRRFFCIGRPCGEISENHAAEKQLGRQRKQQSIAPATWDRLSMPIR